MPVPALSCLPARLHDSVWRAADAAAGMAAPVVASGHGALDAELPGGGWPLGALCEVLQPPRARHEWPLVLPALAAHLRAGGRAVLVGAPLEPFTPALQAAGVQARQLCCISAQGALAAWACEQALRCRDVRAVLAWLPLAQPAMLRRLQLAAAQQQPLLWVFRPEQMRLEASPAPLRLALQARGTVLLAHVFKRRGPPQERPVALPACAPALGATLQAQALRRPLGPAPAGAASTDGRVLHALAGVAAATP